MAAARRRSPANTAAKVLFQTPQPKVTDLTSVHGSWLTDKAYVKTGVKQIVGYDPRQGHPALDAPADRQRLRGDARTSPRTTRPRSPSRAERPAPSTPPAPRSPALDLNTGKLLWQTDVKGANGDRKTRFDEVTLGAGTVAAGGTDGGAAWDLATGKELWKPDDHRRPVQGRRLRRR